MDNVSDDPIQRSPSAPSRYGNKTIAGILLDLRSHFAVQGPRFTFQGPLGWGAYGVTVCVVEQLARNRSRRLVVKRALRSRGENDLKGEIEWMKRLRGGEHIVRLIASRDDTQGPSARRRARWRFFRRSDVEESLEGLLGPVAVMEYLENGELSKLFNRVVRNNFLLPNRILWSFFLCLIRACVALAYPPERGENEPNVLERIPTDGRPESKIEHADLHLGNIMVGNPGGFAEHAIVPPLKFIDFGRTRDGFQGSSDNLYKLSRTMLNLIAQQNVKTGRWIIEHKGVRTRATEILPHGNGPNYPGLDPDLQDLMARCMAVDSDDRPGLGEMLRITENAVYSKTPESFKRPHQETDDAIRDVVQRYIYDADPEHERLMKTKMAVDLNKK
ncbi:kinase-like domain-containing protein [Hypomontagnella monticulosa]|nr:kinase-like domain-containing protein [Hypomontagnella monticulosa]